MLPRKFFKNLHTVKAILVRYFEQILFKFFPQILSVARKMMHFVTFSIMRA